MPATDLEKLVVQLSADVKAYEREMKRAVGVTTAQVNQLRNSTEGVNRASAAAFRGGASNVVQFRRQTERADVSIGRLRENTGNLVSQFNDIGAQLAGGQSPFLIAIQQGTQINQVLGQRGALGAVQALKAAFFALLNPVNFITIGLIAAGGAAIQYFASLINFGDSSEETLKKQADLLKQVAQEWGDAVPALKAYSDEMERQSKLTDLVTASQNRQRDILTDFQSKFNEFVRENENLISLLPDVNREFTKLGTRVQLNADTTETLNRIAAALDSFLSQNAIPTVAEFARKFDQLAASAIGAANQIAQVGSQALTATQSLQAFHAAEQQSREAWDRQVTAAEQVTAEIDKQSRKSESQLEIDKRVADLRSEYKDASAEQAVTEKQLVDMAREQLRLEDQKADAKAKDAARTKELQKIQDAQVESQKALQQQTIGGTQFVSEQERLVKLGQDQVKLQQQVAGIQKQAASSGKLITEQQALAIAKEQLRVENQREEAQRNDEARSERIQKIHEADAASIEAQRKSQAGQGEFIAEQQRLAALTGDQLKLEQEVASVRREAAAQGVALTQQQAESLARANIAADESRSAAAKSAKGSKEATDKEREAVEKLIEELQFEASIVAFNDLQKQKATALRQAGTAATEAERASIERLVEFTYKQTEAIEANKDALERLKSVSRDVFSGLFEDLRDGVDGATLLANALNRVAEALVNAGIETLLTGAFKNAGPGGFLATAASLFHQGGIAGGPAPTRVVPTAAFVGARRYHSGGYAGFGPNEVPVIAKRGEPIGYPSQNTHISVDVTGARGNQEIMTMVQAGVQRGLEQQNRSLPDRVSRISGDPRYRG